MPDWNLRTSLWKASAGLVQSVYSDPMRNPSHHRPAHSVLLTAVTLILTAGTLSGCSAATVPAPSDTAEPVAAATRKPIAAPPAFASNEKALAAAKAAYANYLAAGDAAGAPGTDSWNEYLALATGAEFDGVTRAGKLMEKNGWTFTGITQFDSMTVQSSRALADSTWEVRTYLCLDLSATDTINEAGESVVSSDRPARSPMVVVFVTPNRNSQQLLISESPVWSGSNFCS